MSADTTAIVRRYFDHWGEAEQVRAALASDFAGHLPEAPQPLDREAFIEAQAAMRAAFPDFAPTIEDQIADGDKVVSRLTFRGTHQGDFQGVPATGKQVAIGAITIERVADDKIAEHWIVYDGVGLMQQLGAVPAQ